MTNLSGTPYRRLLADNRRSFSRELGVTESQIHKWRRADSEKGDGKYSGAGLTETAALKKRIRELEMENEILKEAALIFGRGS